MLSEKYVIFPYHNKGTDKGTLLQSGAASKASALNIVRIIYVCATDKCNSNLYCLSELIYKFSRQKNISKPAHCVLEENTPHGFQLQEAKQEGRHRHAKVLN